MPLSEDLTESNDSRCVMPRRTDNIQRYYDVIETERVGGVTRKLIRFHLPDISSRRRNGIVNRVFNESKADMFIEYFWTRDSIIHRERQNFYGILVFSQS